MEVINVRLVEVALNPGDNFKKYLCIENKDSYEFTSVPDLFHTGFTKAEYQKLIAEGILRIKELPNQPEITYIV